MNEICDLSVVVLEGKSSVILFLTMINLCVCVCVSFAGMCVGGQRLYKNLVFHVFE